MKIPFAIGLNSSNEPQYIDLAQVPLLMVSYTDSKELQRYFSQITGGITAAELAGNFLIANSRHLPSNPNGWSYFLTDEPESGTHNTRAKLLNAVLREMQLRQRIMKQKRITNFEKYHALNLWNTVKLPYKLLLIDDIWNLVKAKPVSLSIQLFRIILNGPAVGVHTIIGSNISYRNLLQHLIELNPAIRKMLQEKYGIPEPTQISSIAQELILTPDHLVFYKKSSLMDLEKFYPLL
ncbi:MAG: hypothetical protein Q7U77_12500 [Sediminibacterium sp.]|uniref:hypothetical protein n=1 Tax=Sediminibacterium sp. TaxID=1917865 RepID=UPI00272415F8|nr:hypothetical protein [Sediminibacterium sp.]MDO8997440.1 hypothetical protein [Sediminibacterium sp.]